MKLSLVIIGILIILTIRPLFSQVSDTHPNQVLIRNDKVFVMNGKPFFPIGVCFELGENAYNHEMKKPNGGTYGFNFINLFTQNANLYNCFGSRNVISGDLSSGSQYDDILHVYWDSTLTAESNYQRIKDYLDNGVYLLSDNFAFHPNDYTHWAWSNIPSCADEITINPPFNQQGRNSAIERVNDLASLQGSKIFGYYSLDDANMFMGGPNNDPMYYYNNFKNNRIQNLLDSYNHARSVYSNSIVLMSLPATFFPRALDYSNWPDVNSSRAAWINDAIQLSKGANVFFAPGYLTMEDPSWTASFRIYDKGYPNYILQHIKETLINKVLSTSSEPKAVLGGLIFDIWQSNPAWNDPKMNDKVKWEIYAGLQSGATGLIFFGWHKKDEDFIDHNTGKRIYYRPIWDAIRHQVDTLVNIKHLDSVFTKTNSGAIGHSVSGSLIGGNVSYAVYKTDNNSWNDYYLLLTNNPTGSLFGPDEGINNINVVCNAHSLEGYSVREVFSGRTVTNSDQNSFTYTLPWFGTALFHISNQLTQNITPDDFFINQNYPNPFNPVTKIDYGISKDAFVNISVYDGLGRFVKNLVNEFRTPGHYLVTFDGTNYSSGLYFYKMKIGNFEQTKKMLIVK